MTDRADHTHGHGRVRVFERTGTVLLGVTLTSSIASPLLLSDAAARHLPEAVRGFLAAPLLLAPWAVQLIAVVFRIRRGGRRILGWPFGREDVSFHIYTLALMNAIAFGRELGRLVGPPLHLASHGPMRSAALAVMAAWALADAWGRRVTSAPAD